MQENVQENVDCSANAVEPAVSRESSCAYPGQHPLEGAAVGVRVGERTAGRASVLERVSGTLF